MGRFIAATVLIACTALAAPPPGGPEPVVNLLETAPYADAGMGKRKLADEKYLLMMQAALKPGQSVPQHNADSNVHLIILEGEVVVNLAGNDTVARKGALVPVAFKTPMNIRNESTANATFVIIKTPHPGNMRE